MNWNGRERKQLFINLRYYPGILLGGSERSHEELKSGSSVSRPEIEPRISRTEVTSVTLEPSYSVMNFV
jgi:hypothetical protein